MNYFFSSSRHPWNAALFIACTHPPGWRLVKVISAPCLRLANYREQSRSKSRYFVVAVVANVRGGCGLGNERLWFTVVVDIVFA